MVPEGKRRVKETVSSTSAKRGSFGGVWMRANTSTGSSPVIARAAFRQ